MNLIFSSTRNIPVDELIELYRRAGLPRPIGDRSRMQKVLENSNLVVSAWDQNKLVAVSRCITDWEWSCYLADLAVDPEYQQHGIGRKLIDTTREQLGPRVMLLLLSVPTAMDYYPKVGFNKENRAFSIERSE